MPDLDMGTPARGESERVVDVSTAAETERKYDQTTKRDHDHMSREHHYRNCVLLVKDGA
jgi:hypothetical protein